MAYDGLSHPRKKKLLRKWRKEAEKADKKRGDALNIYDISQKEGRD